MYDRITCHLLCFVQVKLRLPSDTFDLLRNPKYLSDGLFQKQSKDLFVAYFFKMSQHVWAQNIETSTGDKSQEGALHCWPALTSILDSTYAECVTTEINGALRISAPPSFRIRNASIQGVSGIYYLYYNLTQTLVHTEI